MTDRGTATVGIFLITYRTTSLVHLYLLIRPICLASIMLATDSGHPDFLWPVCHTRFRN